MGNPEQLGAELSTAVASVLNSTNSLSSSLSTFSAVAKKVEQRHEELSAWQASLDTRWKMLNELNNSVTEKEKALELKMLDVCAREKLLRGREQRWQSAQDLEVSISEDEVTLNVGGIEFATTKSKWVAFTSSILPEYSNKLSLILKGDTTAEPGMQAKHKVFDARGLLAKYQAPMQMWLPNHHITLLYKATQDGFSAVDYHRQCDGRGATLTVVLSQEGFLFGGYSRSRVRGEKVVLHPSCFLFTLTNPHCIPPTQYLLHPSEQGAVKYELNKHMCLGLAKTSYEIEICSNSNKKSESFCKFPYSHIDTTGKGKHTFTGNDHFKTQEIEIYSVTPAMPILEINKLDSTQGYLLSDEVTKWLPDRRFLLLHQSSRDGLTATDFFSSCLWKEHTLTIVRSEEGFVFGGFSTSPFTPKEDTPLRPADFIFTLSNPHSLPPTLYFPQAHKIKSPKEVPAMVYILKRSFAIGGGADMNISFSEVSFSFPNCFIDSTGKGSSTFTGSPTCKVRDMEVYSVL